MTPNRWQPYEWKKVTNLLSRGYSVPAIAAMIGRKDYQLRDKIRWEQMSVEKREERSAQLRARRTRQALEQKTARVHLEVVSTAKRPPDELLTERQHRSDLKPRDLTAAFFGDPLPGYSALDRKQQAGA